MGEKEFSRVGKEKEAEEEKLKSFENEGSGGEVKRAKEKEEGNLRCHLMSRSESVAEEEDIMK